MSNNSTRALARSTKHTNSRARASLESSSSSKEVRPLFRSAADSTAKKFTRRATCVVWNHITPSPAFGLFLLASRCAHRDSDSLSSRRGAQRTLASARVAGLSYVRTVEARAWNFLQSLESNTRTRTARISRRAVAVVYFRDNDRTVSCVLSVLSAIYLFTKTTKEHRIHKDKYNKICVLALRCDDKENASQAEDWSFCLFAYKLKIKIVRFLEILSR